MATRTRRKRPSLPAYRPVLLEAHDGERVYGIVQPDKSLFATACNYLSTVRRATAGSRNTSAACATGIAKTLNAARTMNVDIVGRMRSGKFLTIAERARLVALLGQGVSVGTRAAYLSPGLEFLGFVAEIAEERLGVGVKADRYARSSDKFFGSFAEVLRVPSTGDGKREALSGDAKAALARIISSQAACEAIWPDPYVALRNRALMKAGMLEGHRRDELLSMRIGDIDFATGHYWIQRRPDDVDDPRRYQPLVKGFSRKLKLLSSVMEIIVELLAERAKLPFAGSHDFVFTTNAGKPLSRGAVNKDFRTFRTKCEVVGPDFTPHILRYTWNDDFSAYADEIGLDPEREMRARKYKMGWRSSKTAAIYTGRHDRAVADEVSLGMQAAFFRRMRRRDAKPGLIGRVRLRDVKPGLVGRMGRCDGKVGLLRPARSWKWRS